MSVQQSLLNLNLYTINDAPKPQKKRIRYKQPTYKKKYRLSWFNEETQEWFYDSDEKHIFRIKDLQKIYSLIYGYCGIDLFEHSEIIERNGLICWLEDRQAEIKDTLFLPLKDRVLIHLKLLRFLRQGKKPEEAIKLVK